MARSGFQYYVQVKMSSFKLLQRLFQVEKPLLLGRWGSVNAVRNSELSNHDHCGTCPTYAVVNEDMARGNISINRGIYNGQKKK